MVCKGNCQNQYKIERAEQRGAVFVETALVIVLIAMVTIVSVQEISVRSQHLFAQAARALSPGLEFGGGSEEGDPLPGGGSE